MPEDPPRRLDLAEHLEVILRDGRPAGHLILERFHEEGESAKSTDRSQLQNLLTFWSCST